MSTKSKPAKPKQGSITRQKVSAKKGLVLVKGVDAPPFNVSDVTDDKKLKTVQYNTCVYLYRNKCIEKGGNEMSC